MKFPRIAGGLLALSLLVSCGSLNEGVVVSKHSGIDPRSPAFGTGSLAAYTAPEVYWIDVEGVGAGGEKTVRRAYVYRDEFAAIRVGDRYSFDTRAVVDPSDPAARRQALAATERRAPAPRATPTPRAERPREVARRPAPDVTEERERRSWFPRFGGRRDRVTDTPAQTIADEGRRTRLPFFGARSERVEPVPPPPAAPQEPGRRLKRREPAKVTEVATRTQPTDPRLATPFIPREMASTPRPAAPVATPAPTPVQPAADEETIRDRYARVRDQGLEDPEVQQLKRRIDTALTSEEQRRLSREYYRLLYQKMREIDPPLRSRIDVMETATFRRLDQMAPPTRNANQ